MLKETQTDEITARENREKQFEPISQGLDKVEKAVKQTDEYLSKKLELIPFHKKVEPNQITFPPEEGGVDIKVIVNKGLVVASKGLMLLQHNL